MQKIAIMYHIEGRPGYIYHPIVLTSMERVDGWLRERHPGQTIVVHDVSPCVGGRAPFVHATFDSSFWRTVTS